MSYFGDDVQTLPWSRCRSLCNSQTEPAEKTVVMPEPTTYPKAKSERLTFTVGDDPADPDNNSAAVIPLRAAPFRVPAAYVKTRRGLWARASTRLLELVCVAWALVARTVVLHRAGA